MKKFYLVTAMMAALLLAGCGQGDKKESEPAKAEAPVVMEPAPVVEPAQEPTEAQAPYAAGAPGYGAPAGVEGAAEAVDKAAQALEQAIKTEAAAIPASVVLEAKMGKVTLPHQKHADMMECATCHGDATPGKLELGKDKAHALCMGCHKEKEAAKAPAGPTKCAGCHVK